MRTSHLPRLLCLGLALGALSLPAGALPQQDASQTAPIPGAQQQGPGPADASHAPPTQDPMAHRLEEHMADRRNSDRQKSLVADTDKLLALAQLLKEEVDKTNKDTLSIDVVKRAEQIEKLARSVKEKMRGN